jgi:hypothetical protein
MKLAIKSPKLLLYDLEGALLTEAKISIAGIGSVKQMMPASKVGVPSMVS